ncbi:MAG: 23S rRNA (adenine(2503)-C(2))-methyltransferase RlmN [Myxococcales bacterium]|nr:23S rRNA (adenine(2503)-C(2))-methyltransferase RlmN [Myxococcales bacterium]
MDVLGLPMPALRGWLDAIGVGAVHGPGVFRGLHHHMDLERVPNLGRHLDTIRAHATLATAEIVERHPAPRGVVRLVFRLHDGTRVEGVVLPNPVRPDRATLCLSSQVGCAMACRFCATGTLKLTRHLLAGEIVAQTQAVRRELGEGRTLTHLVFMGMGEPLHNYGPVLEAVRRMQADLGIGARHITLSTVGLAPQIRRFADEGLQVTLAISLHAADDATRRALMPVNKRYPLDELLDAVRYYVERTKRRVTFEWALIEGENDTPERAAELGRLLRGLPCHVNLIPLNPTGGYAGRPSDPERVAAFVQGLADHGIPATVRVRRGIDIDAGCGQLRERYLDV